MADADERESWGAWLRRECGDLPVLFSVLAFGALLIVAPEAARWAWRAALVALAGLLLWVIVMMRDAGDAVAWSPVLRGPIGAVLALALLGLWGWFLYRGFRAGQWIVPSIATVLIVERAYVEWLKFRFGEPRGRRRGRHRG